MALIMEPFGASEAQISGRRDTAKHAWRRPWGGNWETLEWKEAWQEGERQSVQPSAALAAKSSGRHVAVGRKRDESSMARCPRRRKGVSAASSRLGCRYGLLPTCWQVSGPEGPDVGIELVGGRGARLRNVDRRSTRPPQFRRR